MPLRDHFRPPVSKVASWEAVHGGWPMLIVQSLAPRLPQRYVAQLRVHLGSFAEIDVSASLAVVTDLPAQDAYEVRVYDTERDQRLVAAIELVSPANKDRPARRQAFVGKCAALLQHQVSVTIVDIVTIRAFNLYRELLDFIGQTDPSLGPDPPSVYEVACRATKPGSKPGGPWHLKPGCSPFRSASRCRRCRYGLPMTYPFRSISKRVMRKPARLFGFLEEAAAVFRLALANDCCDHGRELLTCGDRAMTPSLEDLGIDRLPIEQRIALAT